MESFIHVEDAVCPSPILAITRWPEGISQDLVKGISTILCNNKTTTVNGKEVPFREISNLHRQANLSHINDEGLVEYDFDDATPSFSVIELKQREIENILFNWVKFCNGNKLSECSIDIIIFEVVEVNGDVAMGGAWEFKDCVPSVASGYKDRNVLGACLVSDADVDEKEPTRVDFEFTQAKASDYFASRIVGTAAFNILKENGSISLSTVLK